MIYLKSCGVEQMFESFHSIDNSLNKQERVLTRMNDVCLVCGDAGYPEHLISCSECKHNKEHRYCMKVISLSEEARSSWICQECMSVDESLDDVPIAVIFPLKKKIINVKKDAYSTMKDGNFDADNFVGVDEQKKDNPQVAENKASLQEVTRRMTKDPESNNEHDLNIQQEADEPMMISERLMSKEVDIKRTRKALVSDSSNDEMITNDQPTREHSYHEKADSEGSFNMWLDDATETEVVTSSCGNFSFDVKLASHEDNSCKDASGGAELSSVNNNVVLSDNALVTANEDIGEKNALGRRASNDACVETSLVKPRDHNIRPISRNRTNGHGREKISLVSNDFFVSNNNAVDLSGKILRDLPSRKLYDACGHTSPVKPSEDRNDIGNMLEKTNLTRGPSNENVANNHEHVVTNYDKGDDSRPVDEITWRGYFSFGDFNYGVAHAHLTTSSYYVTQVNEEVKKLNGVLRLEKVPNRIAWPPRFYTSSSPNENDIALYFFPSNDSDKGWYDALVRELGEKDVTYRAILECSELLIFPSVLLPDYYQKFSGRRYLWGSFRRKQTDQPKPTNGDLPCDKHINANPARIDSNSHPLKRKAVNVTHASLSHQKKSETARYPKRRAYKQNAPYPKRRAYEQKKSETGVIPDRRAGENSNSLELMSGRLPPYPKRRAYEQKKSETGVIPDKRAGENSNSLELTSGRLPPYPKRRAYEQKKSETGVIPDKRAGENSNSLELMSGRLSPYPKRRAYQQKKSETGVIPDRRAGENSNSLELMSGRLPHKSVVDRHVKSGFDSSTHRGSRVNNKDKSLSTHRGSRVNNKDKSLLNFLPLQVENIAVVSKLDKHTIFNLELDVGLGFAS